MEALFTLADDVMRAVCPGHEADDVRHGAHAIEVDGLGIRHLGIALRKHADLPLLADRLLDGQHRSLSAYCDGQDDFGKEHQVPNRKNDQGVGRRTRFLWLLRRRARGLLIDHQISPVFLRRKSRQPWLEDHRMA